LQDKTSSIPSQNSPAFDCLPGERNVLKKILAPRPFSLETKEQRRLINIKNRGMILKEDSSLHPQKNTGWKKHFYLMLPLSFLCLSFGTTGCVVVLDEKNFPKLPNSTLTPTPTQKILNPTTLERSIHEQVNEYRRSQNLPPLTLDSHIIEVARQHSKAMANGQATFSHDGFDQRVKTISQKIDYGSAGENLAYNFGYSDPGKQAVIGWIKSPGHRKNMEGNFDLTGIGVAQNAKGEYYFTQLFIRQR
jgi:hypothetical protein